MRSRLLVLLTVLALLAAACGSSDDEESGGGAAPDDATPAADAPTDEADEADEGDESADPGEETSDAGDDASDDTPTDDTEAEEEPEPDPEPEATEPTFDFSAVDPIIEDFIAERELNGAAFVVAHRDYGIIDERFWGVFDADRVSLIASSSKMVVAAVLLALDDAGVLDIDAPIADVLPYAGDHPEITTAQLLSNSSGLPGLLEIANYGPYLCAFSHLGSMQECAEAILTTPDDDADVIPPDTEFDYGGAQWQVAGAVAEAASGQSWAELIDELFVEPCGLETFGFNNAFSQVETAGFSHPPGFDNNPEVLVATDNPNMEGGAFSNTTDYVELMLMHLRGGYCGDTQVLSQDALDQMHADRVAAVYGGDAGNDPGTGYGMGWWVDRETGIISDGGAFGSVPWLDLEDGYGAFLLTESNSGWAGAVGRELQPIVDDAIATALA